MIEFNPNDTSNINSLHRMDFKNEIYQENLNGLSYHILIENENSKTVNLIKRKIEHDHKFIKEYKKFYADKIDINDVLSSNNNVCSIILRFNKEFRDKVLFSILPPCYSEFMKNMIDDTSSDKESKKSYYKLFRWNSLELINLMEMLLISFKESSKMIIFDIVKSVNPVFYNIENENKRYSYEDFYKNQIDSYKNEPSDKNKLLSIFLEHETTDNDTFTEIYTVNENDMMTLIDINNSQLTQWKYDYEMKFVVSPFIENERDLVNRISFAIKYFYYKISSSYLNGTILTSVLEYTKLQCENMINNISSYINENYNNFESFIYFDSLMDKDNRFFTLSKIYKSLQTDDSYQDKKNIDYLFHGVNSISSNIIQFNNTFIRVFYVLNLNRSEFENLSTNSIINIVSKGYYGVSFIRNKDEKEMFINIIDKDLSVIYNKSIDTINKHYKYM